MTESSNIGWRKFLDGCPWLDGAGRYPIPAYSEFMPPPRVGVSLYGDVDASVFRSDDPYGWRVPEVEEAYELRPGLDSVAQQVMTHLIRFVADQSSVFVAGQHGRNLIDNVYWSAELASRAAELVRRCHVLLLSLSLSKTQDDRGRVRWTLFGSSEQGPERAFWNSFYTAPDKEQPARKSHVLICEILSSAYGVVARTAEELYRVGFRVMASGHNEELRQWTAPLPGWTKRFEIAPDARLGNVRYLLTFRPFDELPDRVRRGYLDGSIELLPTPLSLLFWGMQIYRRARQQYPLAMQFPLLRLVNRHEGAGLRVPQFGWLHHPHPDGRAVDFGGEIMLNEYARTHRWDRVPRDEDSVPKSLDVDAIAATLFSTELSDLDLYHKPMARNCQIWTRDGELVLHGPSADRAAIQRAARVVQQGGIFLYRFEFPAMRVGRHEVYWQRPLAACWSPQSGVTKLLDVELPGYMTAYDCEQADYVDPVVLYPRILNRPPYFDALHRVDATHDHYRNQTSLNILNILDMAERSEDARLPRMFARQMLRVARDKQHFDEWLASVGTRCTSQDVAARLTRAIGKCVAPRNERLPESITYRTTATRAYEEAYWRDLVMLSQGHFVNKSNSDVIRDAPTLNRVTHLQRDLFALGEYLIGRHRSAIASAGLEGIAHVGELPFRWETDFEYPGFGGWVANQDGTEYERNILMVIPGNNRSEAVVMGDHYDTAYMEDVFETSRGGDGARVSAQGADDNASATATLLLAAPIFLQLAKEGKLERDVWLIHLTGEEFPSDCMGARAFCQMLVERTLRMRIDGARSIDLSQTKVVGVLVMDMIAHNRDGARNVFQISPGRSEASLKLAYHAHLANMIWNQRSEELNGQPERRGRGPGVRSADALTIPEVARYPLLDGEVRTTDNPQSSLFNTDVQIFSDIGAPCVLMMENYDINRTGYHDTYDTLKNIDLDYGAALSAICIETIARVATS